MLPKCILWKNEVGPSSPRPPPSPIMQPSPFALGRWKFLQKESITRAKVAAKTEWTPKAALSLGAAAGAVRISFSGGWRLGRPRRRQVGGHEAMVMPVLAGGAGARAPAVKAGSAWRLTSSWGSSEEE